MVAVLTLLLGDGLLRHAGNLYMRQFKWETGPLVDQADTILAEVSHDYESKQTITEALVVAQQPLLRRLLFLLRGERLQRWVEVVPLAHGSLEIGRGEIQKFTDKLPATASLPTWNIFRSRVTRPTKDVRLIFLVKASRRRTMTRKLKRPSGVVDQRPLETAAEQS